jgi:hypothetical protein
MPSSGRRGSGRDGKAEPRYGSMEALDELAASRAGWGPEGAGPAKSSPTTGAEEGDGAGGSRTTTRGPSSRRLDSAGARAAAVASPATVVVASRTRGSLKRKGEAS